MMGHNYELVFRKSSKNSVADALSKLPYASFNAITMYTNELLDRIKHSWLSDPRIVHLIHKAKNAGGQRSKYSWQTRLLKRKGKLVIGDDPILKIDLLRYFHSSPEGDHSGMDATSRRIGAVVYWKTMKKAIRAFVRKCIVYQKYKPDLSASPRFLQPLLIPDKV